MNIISKMLLSAATAISIAGIAEQAAARPTIGMPSGERRTISNGSLRTTAAACNPATATIDLDINNVRAKLMTGGDMWWDRGTSAAAYEIPKGSKKNSLYAGSVWVAGEDEQGILKVAGQTYRTKGNDYWPGPTQVAQGGINTAPDKTVCSDWDKFWKINRATLIEFREELRSNPGVLPSGEKYQTILEWPATGNRAALGTSGLPLPQLTEADYLNAGRNYAPFIDVDGDGRYSPIKGDYPDILGDQYIWWVFNDMGNVKLQTESVSIGMEVQTSAFAFSSKDFLNDASFVFYKLINRGVLNLEKTYMATWTDADLGDAQDDYIGCDTGRSLGILYNGKSADGTGKPTDYGSAVPMIGVDFFIGPKRREYVANGVHINSRGQRYNEDTLGMTVFNYFNSGSGNLGDPTNGQEMYRIMTGYNRIGQHLTNDQAACPNSTAYGPGPEINYVWPGNPERSGDWSECICGTTTGDRRFVHSSGPFRLEAGGITNDIIIGACWVPNVGGCPNTSFSRIRAADDMIQDLFDNRFRTIEGPEAPRLVVREMDRKLVFYLVNDPTSTNYKEQFGFSNDPFYRVSTPRTRRLARNGDSIYKFQGYRVFQLKNSNVSLNDIFNTTTGEVNKDLAAEVFSTDRKDSIKGNIVNHVADPDKAPGEIYGQLKVTAKDSGLQHSFQLVQDAFAKGTDKRFVNYKSYYFVAIAWAYNNFRPFSYEKSDSTQTLPYLESSHAAGGRNIPVVAAMPNPANGDMGTVLNADFGDGVIIRRLEGIGNGGNATAFNDTTEAALLAGPNYQSFTPTYKENEGPVKIRVVDPRKVASDDWKLYIYGPSPLDTLKGIIANDPASGWKLVNASGDTIYSERNLAVQNEQILEKYGISVNINQVARPGDADAVNNGLITSDITFADPNLIWMAGVPDVDQQTSPLNWIRSGTLEQPKNQPIATNCNYADIGAPLGNPDEDQVYENLLSGSTVSKSSWAPVMLAVEEKRGECGFGVVNISMQGTQINRLNGIDVVFTSDKSKWTKCVVMELQDEPTLSEGRTAKFFPRKHQSWNGDVDASDRPIYSTTAGDTGFSFFPGYAVNVETGERLNIVFGEDSYLKSDNGADMIWNPSNRITDPQGGVIFGGKHYVYVQSTKYDEGKEFFGSFDGSVFPQPNYRSFRWVGLPVMNTGFSLKPLKDGLIPTDTRVRFRVTRPYGRYAPTTDWPLENEGNPVYMFTTKGLAPTALADNASLDKNTVLDQIHVTPNPYYGYVGYETGRLDTRVRIINLPRTATINIYSVDGTLIRTLTKDNPNQSFIDWDTRNSKGLAIASGMYLVHVKADGIGEKVIRWFGAMRPVDLTTY
jgi:hypothetical protein